MHASPRARLYQGPHYRGHVASKRRCDRGLELHLLVTRHGAPVQCVLTLAATADVGGLRDFGSNRPPGATRYADRATTGYAVANLLHDTADIIMGATSKASSTPAALPWSACLQHHYSKAIETIGRSF